MHRRGGQDRRHAHAVEAERLVADDDHRGAVLDRLDGLGAQTFERPLQARAGLHARLRHLEGGVEMGDHAGIVELDHAFVHKRRQERAFQHEDIGLGRVGRQYVAEVLEARLQRHARSFAQRIDRRVGHLGEVLAEEVSQRPPLVRQHGQGCIVAHRADGFLAVLDHGVEHGVEILDRKAGGDLAALQVLAEQLARFRSGRDQRLELDHVLDPAGVVVLGGQGVEDFILLVEAAFVEVDGDHAARRDVQAAQHAVLGDAGHAGFGADDHQAVVRFGDAQRTQAVAVLAGDDPAAVGGADRRRTVPRLHDGVAIAVERPVRRRHGGVVRRPGLGDQQGLGHRRRTAGADQQFEDVVEAGGIRAARLDHRLDVAVVAAEGRRRHADLVRLHPVDIAAQGVDLAIVRQHAERLRQAPFREGVGREALVEDGDAGDEARVFQVEIEVVDQFGAEHALVDQGPGRERAQIAVEIGLIDALFDAAAAQEHGAFQRFAVQTVRRGHHDLFDFRPRRHGAGAQLRHVDRRLAPAIEVKARAQDFRLDDGPRRFLGAEVGARQEDLADQDRARPRRMADIAHLLAEEVLRHIDHDARAVARLAVGIDRAAVEQGLQRLDGEFDDVTARRAVDRGDEADAAGVLFRGRIVGMAVDQGLAVAVIEFVR